MTPQQPPHPPQSPQPMPPASAPQYPFQQHPFQPGPVLPGPQQQGPLRPGPHRPGPSLPGRPARFTGLVLTCRIAAVVLVALGLSIPFDDTSGWVSTTAWAVFAMLAAIVQLLPAFAGALGWTPQRAWLVCAAGTGALLVFWLLIALPGISGNDGFCLTLAAAAATAGCALAPGRPW